MQMGEVGTSPIELTPFLVFEIRRCYEASQSGDEEADLAKT